MSRELELKKIFRRSYGRHARVLTLAAGLAAISLTCTNALGFTVANFELWGIFPIPAQGNHEGITLNALGAPHLTATGQTLSFTQAAKSIISNANASTDSESSGDPKVHFDNETFSDGVRLLYDRRNIIVGLALAGQYLAAQEELGRALHTVQDFYAHTTWVEKNRPGLAPLGYRAVEPLIQSTGRTCTESATQNISGFQTGIVQDQQLTGEFFKETQVFPGGNTTWANSDQKCIHGDGRFTSNEPKGAGINKDNANRFFFVQAYAKGVEASKQYIDLILSDLWGNDAATRGLLGITGGTRYTISFSNLGGLAGTPFNNYTEGVFLVASTAGSWLVDLSRGVPSPAIISNSDVSAITVTAGGSQFTFDSVTLGTFYLVSDPQQSPVDFKGSLNGVVKYRYGPTYGGFNGLGVQGNPYSAIVIDSLTVTVQNFGTAYFKTVLDNIELHRK